VKRETKINKKALSISVTGQKILKQKLQPYLGYFDAGGAAC
jgi:hypothetical protein